MQIPAIEFNSEDRGSSSTLFQTSTDDIVFTKEASKFDELAWCCFELNHFQCNMSSESFESIRQNSDNRSKISYTREFLLLKSEISKHVPNGLTQASRDLISSCKFIPRVEDGKKDTQRGQDVSAKAPVPRANQSYAPEWRRGEKWGGGNKKVPEPNHDPNKPKTQIEREKPEKVERTERVERPENGRRTWGGPQTSVRGKYGIHEQDERLEETFGEGEVSEEVKKEEARKREEFFEMMKSMRAKAATSAAERATRHKVEVWDSGPSEKLPEAPAVPPGFTPQPQETPKSAPEPLPIDSALLEEALRLEQNGGSQGGEGGGGGEREGRFSRLGGKLSSVEEGEEEEGEGKGERGGEVGKEWGGEGETGHPQGSLLYRLFGNPSAQSAPVDHPPPPPLPPTFPLPPPPHAPRDLPPGQFLSLESLEQSLLAEAALLPSPGGPRTTTRTGPQEDFPHFAPTLPPQGRPLGPPPDKEARGEEEGKKLLAFLKGGPGGGGGGGGGGIRGGMGEQSGWPPGGPGLWHSVPSSVLPAVPHGAPHFERNLPHGPHFGPVSGAHMVFPLNPNMGIMAHGPQGSGPMGPLFHPHPHPHLHPLPHHHGPPIFPQNGPMPYMGPQGGNPPLHFPPGLLGPGAFRLGDPTGMGGFPREGEGEMRGNERGRVSVEALFGGKLEGVPSPSGRVSGALSLEDLERELRAGQA